MAFDITDDSRLEILVDDGWRQWYIPKFRIEMAVSGDEVYLYWTDSERGTVGVRRLLVMDYNDVTFGYLTPSSASEVVTVIDSYIISAWTDITSSTVSSVTDDGNGVVEVDNTIPTQPIIKYKGLSPLLLMGG